MCSKPSSSPFQLPAVDDLPLAVLPPRTRPESGPAAEGVEAEPFEEAPGRPVRLVDHGPHSRHAARARLVEKAFHQPRAQGPAAGLTQEVHVQMAGVAV